MDPILAPAGKGATEKGAVGASASVGKGATEKGAVGTGATATVAADIGCGRN